MEGVEALAAGDDVQEVAMLTGGEVDPLSGRAVTTVGAFEAHRKAAARGIFDVADAPGVALATPIGEIGAAHGLGVVCEAAREIRRTLGHAALP
jgi:hypothetical protein